MRREAEVSGTKRFSSFSPGGGEVNQRTRQASQAMWPQGERACGFCKRSRQTWHIKDGVREEMRVLCDWRS